jgi:hypothetical protein
MPRTPLSEAERVARRFNKQLSDIANKLDRMGSKQIEPIKLPSFDKFEDEVERTKRGFHILNVLSKQYRANIKDIDEAQKRAQAGIKRYTSHLDELTEQHRLLSARIKELEKLTEDNTEATEKDRKELEAKKEALKSITVAQGNYNRQLEKYKGWADRLDKFEKSGAAKSDAWKKWAPKFMGKLTSMSFKGLSALTGEVTSRLASQLTAVYEMQNRFRSAFAGIAAAVGPTTVGLKGLQEAAKDAYFDKGGLGELGMTLEQITQAFGEMAAAAEYSDLITENNAQTMTKYGRAVGLSNQEVGQLVKSFSFMGENEYDAQRQMGVVNTMAKKLKINTNVLSKEVFVAGKNLLAMAGPKFQDEMIRAVASMKKMGMSAQEFEKFTDMTDSIEGVTTSMAKMNTVFGTHIDILRVFSEQDPSKRMQIILDQMTAQGIRLDTMDRIHRKFMA